MGACRFFFPSLGVWLLLYALGPGLALVLFPGCGFFYMPLGFCLTSPARQSISGFFVWQLIEVSINLVVGGGVMYVFASRTAMGVVELLRQFCQGALFCITVSLPAAVFDFWVSFGHVPYD